jgi:hypothetical protein
MTWSAFNLRARAETGKASALATIAFFASGYLLDPIRTAE